MKKVCCAFFWGGFSLLLITAFFGCQESTNQGGIHVMFSGSPKIHQDQVYYHSRVVGRILNQEIGKGSVAKVTIKIDPEFKQTSGEHWAYYVENGRLSVGRLISSGNPIREGEHACGFLTKADFAWFKVKTLLGHRVAKAKRRAEKLFQQFSQSG